MALDKIRGAARYANVKARRKIGREGRAKVRDANENIRSFFLSPKKSWPLWLAAPAVGVFGAMFGLIGAGVALFATPAVGYGIKYFVKNIAEFKTALGEAEIKSIEDNLGEETKLAREIIRNKETRGMVEQITQKIKNNLENLKKRQSNEKIPSLTDTEIEGIVKDLNTILANLAGQIDIYNEINGIMISYHNFIEHKDFVEAKKNIDRLRDIAENLNNASKSLIRYFARVREALVRELAEIDKSRYGRIFEAVPDEDERSKQKRMAKQAALIDKYKKILKEQLNFSMSCINIIVGQVDSYEKNLKKVIESLEAVLIEKIRKQEEIKYETAKESQLELKEIQELSEAEKKAGGIVEAQKELKHET
jgi:hypothetical protein